MTMLFPLLLVMDSGKYYFEVLLRAGSSSVLSSLIGIAPDTYLELKRRSQNAWPGKDTDSGVGIADLCHM